MWQTQGAGACGPVAGSVLLPHDICWSSSACELTTELGSSGPCGLLQDDSRHTLDLGRLLSSVGSLSPQLSPLPVNLER